MFVGSQCRLYGKILLFILRSVIYGTASFGSRKVTLNLERFVIADKTTLLGMAGLKSH